MIYGYCGNEVGGNGLFEMKEITFSMSSEGLRAISTFLNSMANEIDKGQLSDSSHQHIEQVISNWNELCPDHDIIVMSKRS